MKKIRASKVHIPETAIQAAIVDCLTRYGIMCFSVPNGAFLGGSSKLNKILVYKKLQREGLRKGASDLVIVENREVIFVEVKSMVGDQSEEQKQFQEDVEKRGHKYLIWRSTDDAISFAKSRGLVSMGRNNVFLDSFSRIDKVDPIDASTGWTAAKPEDSFMLSSGMIPCVNENGRRMRRATR